MLVDVFSAIKASCLNKEVQATFFSEEMQSLELLSQVFLSQKQLRRHVVRLINDSLQGE